MVWCDPIEIQSLPRTQQQSQLISQTSPLIQGYWISPQSDTFLVLNAAEIFANFQR
jgi:hypothetical protein